MITHPFSRVLRLLAAVTAAAVLAGCLTPQASLLLSLLPEGTFTTMLNNMKGVDESNRKRLADLEDKNDWQGIAQFAQANIAKDPTVADWWTVAGYAYAQLGQYEQAARHFQEALRIDPLDIDSWNLLAQTYRAMGQPERAIRTLDNALRVTQESAVTYYLLGQSYNDLGRPDRAVPFYEQATQKAPTFVDAWYSLGATYLRLGRRTDFDIVVARLRQLHPQAADQLVALSERGPAPQGAAKPPAPTPR